MLISDSDSDTSYLRQSWWLMEMIIQLHKVSLLCNDKLRKNASNQLYNISFLVNVA